MRAYNAVKAAIRQPDGYIQNTAQHLAPFLPVQLHRFLRMVLHNGMHRKQRQRTVFPLPGQHPVIGVLQAARRQPLPQVLQGNRPAHLNKAHNLRLCGGNHLCHGFAGFH